MTIAIVRPFVLAAAMGAVAPAWAANAPRPRPSADDSSAQRTVDDEPAPRPTEEPADDAGEAVDAASDERSAEEERPRKRRRSRHGKGGDVSMGQPVVIGEGQENDDEIVVMGSSVRIDGRQEGDVVVLGGSAKISGEVDGNVVVIGGLLELAETAQIDGDAVAVGGRMKREEGAVITGQTVDMGGFGFLPAVIHDWSWGFGLGSLFLMSALSWLKTAAAAVLLAVLIAAVMPGRVETASVALRDRWFECFGFGLVTFFVCVVATPLLCITCVGAVLPWLFYQVAKYFGMAALFIVVGQALARAGFNRDLSPLPALLVGFVVLALLGLLFPFMWWVYGWLSVGAAVTTKFGAQAWMRSSAPPPPPPAPLATAGDAIA
jgi:hypothetical protein